MGSLALATTCHPPHQPLQSGHRRCLSPQSFLCPLPMRKSWPPYSSSMLKRSHIKAMLPGGNQPRLTKEKLKKFLYKSIFVPVITLLSGLSFLFGGRRRPPITPSIDQEQLISNQEEEETSYVEVRDPRVFKIQEAVGFMDNFLAIDPEKMDWDLARSHARKRAQNLDFAERLLDDIRHEDKIVESEYDSNLAEKQHLIRSLKTIYDHQESMLQMYENIAADLDVGYKSFFLVKLSQMRDCEEDLDKDISYRIRDEQVGGSTQERMDYTFVLYRKPYECHWRLMVKYLQWRMKKLDHKKEMLEERLSEGDEELKQLYERTCGFMEGYQSLETEIKGHEAQLAERKVSDMRRFKSFYSQHIKEEKFLYDFVGSLLKAKVVISAR